MSGKSRRLTFTRLVETRPHPAKSIIQMTRHERTLVVTSSIRHTEQLDVVEQPDVSVLGRDQDHLRRRGNRRSKRPLHRLQRPLVHDVHVVDDAAAVRDGLADESLEVRGILRGSVRDGQLAHLLDQRYRLADARRVFPVLRRQPRVPAAHGEAVGFSRQGYPHDVDLEVEVADHAPDDAPLLVVLLAKHRHVGLAYVEQLAHHGGDPSEEVRPRL
mmetsp:Transcript_4279/g.15965  ORF Transcript_4279/g.15965 Transcript_4279/m.15965 type:complete len:216 (-) Transcript_4279:495-1142(-)